MVLSPSCCDVHIQNEGIYCISRCIMLTFFSDAIIYNRASSQNWGWFPGFWLGNHGLEMRYKTALFAVWSRNNRVISWLKLSQVLRFSAQHPRASHCCAQLVMPPVNEWIIQLLQVHRDVKLKNRKILWVVAVLDCLWICVCASSQFASTSSQPRAVTDLAWRV